MESPERSRASCVAVLVGAHAAAYGVFAFRLGFYHDDWAILGLLHGAGFWGGVQAFAASNFYWARPMQMLQFPALFALGGMHPWFYQLVLLLLSSVESCLLFLLLERLTRSRRLALTAAALSALYPGAFIEHIWLSNSSQVLTNVLSLAAMLLHLDWIETGARRRLVLGQGLYLLGGLFYESCFFAPLLLAGGLSAARVRDGWSWRRALARTALEMLPFGLTLAAVVGWQWAGVRLVPGGCNPKSAEWSFSWTHFLRAYGAGFECLTNRVVHAAALTLRGACREFGLGRWLAWGAASAALWAALVDGSVGGDAPAKMRTAAGAGLGAFVGGYLPYAVHSAYLPQMFGIMSRTNGCGAWAAGILLACLLHALRRAGGTGFRRWSGAALALVLGAFLWTDWQFARQWAEAWRIQREVLAECVRRAPALPQGSTVLLADFDHVHGWAIVFDAPYEFRNALRISTGRKDLVGRLAGTEEEKPPAGSSAAVRPGYVFRYAAGEFSELPPGRGLKPAP
jgi:hypothetical protein